MSRVAVSLVRLLDAVEAFRKAGEKAAKSDHTVFTTAEEHAIERAEANFVTAIEDEIKRRVKAAPFLDELILREVEAGS